MNTNPRGLLGGLRSWLGGSPPSSAPPAPARHQSGYMRGGNNVTLAGWRPPLREPQVDVGIAWDQAAARSTDLIQNSGWLAGMIEQAVANTVGTGLRLLPKPENSIFGMDEKQARAWARKVASRWEVFSRSPQECDIEGLRDFGKMQAAAFRHWLATGEILAELPYRKRPWNRYGTKVRLLPPHRLSRKSDRSQRLINGVYLDADGMPIAYLSQRRDEFGSVTDHKVRARTAFGRTVVSFTFDGLPGTYRGIGPLTPALLVARQMDQLNDATLMAAIVKQLFAITITGDAPTEEILEGMLTPQELAVANIEGGGSFGAYMDMLAGYYDGSTLDVGINGRLAHLFPGQEMKFVNAPTPGSDYKDYSAQLLREICRCLGMTYTSGTGDYSGAGYSSTRMENTTIFEVTLMRRKNVVAPFCQAVYEAWLEEEIADHGLEFPGGYEGFLANRVAACRADWRGSPKPQADDLKTAKAHEIWKRLGVMSDEMIAADLGVDVEDVYAARRAEMALRAEYGIPEPQVMPAGGGAPSSPDAADDADEEDADE